jgi:hypothetical protein
MAAALTRSASTLTLTNSDLAGASFKVGGTLNLAEIRPMAPTQAGVDCRNRRC